jgi:tetratricopeptide (TPR) repeat protein
MIDDVNNGALGLTAALAELRSGRLDEAEIIGRRLLMETPGDPAAHQLLAAIALQRADHANALRWARSSLELRPDHPPAMILAGRSALGLGDRASALGWFQRARDLSPERPEPAFLLCITQLECGDPGAQSTLERIMQLFPTDAGGWRDIGASLRRAKQLEAAAVAFGRAASASRDPSHGVDLGTVLFELGRPRAAIEVLRRALSIAPDCADALMPLAQCLRQIGETQMAHDLLEQLAVLKPDSGSVHFALALVCDDLHDVQGAIAAYRRCLLRQPDLPEAHVNLGLALQQIGQLDAALGCYREALRLRPDTFGRIAQALCSASKGQLWLSHDRLRRSLGI